MDLKSAEFKCCAGGTSLANILIVPIVTGKDPLNENENAEADVFPVALAPSEIDTDLVGALTQASAV